MLRSMQPAELDLPIDPKFDFRSEVPAGRDPDSWSPTLRSYHRLLWSKPLPDGRMFDLTEEGKPGGYFLRHDSALGTFRLTSDTITHRYLRTAVAKQIPAEALPTDIGYTIASALVFPGTRVDGKQTINQARGTHPRIRDRFDLTLECIRRQYQEEDNPLRAVLTRYSSFFELFVDFDGYVDFFLLHDVIGDDGKIAYWHHFDNFTTPPIPHDVDAYVAYRGRTRDFIRARNTRIADATAVMPS